jgi:proteasome alpha subunit
VQPRKFSRLGPARIESILGDRGPTTPAPPEPREPAPDAEIDPTDIPTDIPADTPSDTPASDEG